MPRVTYVKKARKDNPVAKKGESYYWWKFRYGPKRYSLTRPRQSQLTQSDKLSRIYAAQESIDDLTIPDASNFDTPSECADAIRNLGSTWQDAIDELRDVAEEYEESATNKEEYFPGTGDEIREKGEAVMSSADEAESEVDEINSIADDIEELANDDDEAFWQDEAEQLIGNIPTSLEVELY